MTPDPQPKEPREGLQRLGQQQEVPLVHNALDSHCIWQPHLRGAVENN